MLPRKRLRERQPPKERRERNLDKVYAVRLPRGKVAQRPLSVELADPEAKIRRERRFLTSAALEKVMKRGSGGEGTGAARELYMNHGVEHRKKKTRQKK